MMLRSLLRLLRVGRRMLLSHTYLWDAGGFVGWDYTSEENRRYKYLRYILNGGRNRQKVNQQKKV